MGKLRLAWIALNLTVSAAIFANIKLRERRLERERRHEAQQAEMRSWRNDPNTINAACDLAVI